MLAKRFQTWLLRDMKQLTKVEDTLSGAAAAVLVEMARRGNVKPEAIARVCIEQTLTQAIDLRISEDGDWWYMHDARNASKSCRKAWREVENPGSYDFAMSKSGRP